MAKVRLLKFDAVALRALIIDDLMSRAERGANQIAKQLRRNISTPGPEPSRPGEYPHKQSGELARSIKVKRRNQFRVDVVVEAPHAAYVEASRPFVSRTVAEMRASVEREIRRGKR